MSDPSGPQPGSQWRRELPPLHTPGRELRRDYHAWLERIDDELIGAAVLVEEALPRTVAGFLGGDRTCPVATRALVHDVHDRAREVEEQGFLLLAREAPVAGDLRRLVGILRLITAVERSASLLGHVADTADTVDPSALPEPVVRQVEELARHATTVFRMGVDAWRQRDGLALGETIDADEAVDRLARGLVAQREQLHDPAQLIALGLLARYLERIADHGVSFAQHGTFAVTGERVEVGRR